MAPLTYEPVQRYPHGMQRPGQTLYATRAHVRYMRLGESLSTVMGSMTEREAQDVLHGWRDRQSRDGVMRDVMDGSTWRKMQEKYFANDCDDMLLISLSFDYLAPFFRDRYASPETKKAKVFFCISLGVSLPLVTYPLSFLVFLSLNLSLYIFFFFLFISI